MTEKNILDELKSLKLFNVSLSLSNLVMYLFAISYELFSVCLSQNIESKLKLYVTHLIKKNLMSSIYLDCKT
jgi:hypothetical protein